MSKETKNSLSSFNTFRALHYPSYRYMWLGQMGHSATAWMEQVVRPLLVLELTGSALQVGLVIAFRMVPQFIFGLLAGVFADRYNKQRILMYSQTVTMLMQLTLAVLIMSGHLEVWHIFATAFISGGSLAFNQPARQSLIPRLVPAEMLLNALALNNSAMNVMRVLGTALAGVLLIFFDYGQIYLLNAVIYVAVIWTTMRIIEMKDSSSVKQTVERQASFFEDFVEGFRYITSNRQVLYLVGMALVIIVLGQSYQQVFVPLFALDVLNIGRSGAGWMLAFTGIGALIGSLILASFGHLRHRGLALMAFIVIFGLALILLAQSTWFPLSALALILAGSMLTSYNALNTSLLLDQTPRNLHGRVMSLMSLDRGLVSVGAIIAGSLAQVLGPQLGLTLISVIMVGLVVLVFIFIPTLRKIQ